MTEREEHWRREIEEWRKSLSADMVAKTKAISTSMTDSKYRLHYSQGDESPEEAQRRKVERMEYDVIFPLPNQTWKSVLKEDWNTSNIPRNFERMTVFRVNDELVPDWMHGFVALDHETALPEFGTDEELKEAIFGVMQDCVSRKARNIRDLLERYRIMAMEFEADFLNRTLRVLAVTNRHVMEVNMVMTNMVVRNGMKGRVIIEIHTQVEPHRRTDDYLHPQPERQHIVRTFIYQDRVLMRNEPESWSAGSNYDVGDVVSVAGITWVVGDDPGNSIPGFAVRRNLRQARADLSPGERAYSKAARNR